jgi:hypothetical protein
MFAPYCRTCGSRQLISITRTVTSDWHTGGTVRVRCHCGTVIDADADPPERLRPAS